MRKPIIAGNWKMFKTRDEALEFIYQVNNDLPSKDLVDSVVCAPFTVLRDLVKRQGENLRIGAQNMHFEESGAFTGEVAPVMLESLEVSYVIIGHSERRAMFNETDESCNKKLHAAFAHNLVPILCVGEYLEQREDGSWKDLIKGQIVADLAGLSESQAKELVIAYEPIWAIGTGKTATPAIADETCGFIRNVIKELYSSEVSEAIRIQYGGSVKTSNIDELMAQPNIDGALIGGASLNAADFKVLVKAAVK
ncbi:MAG: triose-phosphate isomerase [Bacilli bacterium]|nr:triose-phosphate isomerase [Bacilli bacterium]